MIFTVLVSLEASAWKTKQAPLLPFEKLSCSESGIQNQPRLRVLSPFLSGPGVLTLMVTPLPLRDLKEAALSLGGLAGRWGD